MRHIEAQTAHNPLRKEQELTQVTSLPKFSDDLGGFVSRLRTRLFPTQSKAAAYFGLKSHGTISRYESETLRPPLGYLAELIQLYLHKLESEGHPPEPGREHFLREVNRAIRQCYSWDEAPLSNWEELRAVAGEFMDRQRVVEVVQPSLEIQTGSFEEDPVAGAGTISQPWQAFLKEVPRLETLAYLLGDLDKQRELRNRQVMLEVVDEFWIKGVLRNSLHDSILIELGIEERREAVEHPWDLMISTSSRPAHRLPANLKLLEVFNRLGQALLILGQPGAGKTTLLLDLARELIAQAGRDPLQPIPVVFNLSSWAGEPISDWLVTELNSKYKIPRKIGQPWVERDEILPLLDGLDEVAAERRETCVSAINLFHHQHLTPLVVCSRLADYESLTTRLKLKSAICLQPLTPEQIDDYLGKLGPAMEGVRQLLREDKNLQELAQTPLMLTIFTLANGSSPPAQDSGDKTVAASRKDLFKTYVVHMLERKGRGNKPFTAQQTQRWLTWLAQRMIEHNQTIYLIDQMQPTWLPLRQSWLWAYMAISRTVAMVGGGVMIGFVAGMGARPLLGVREGLLVQPGGWLIFGGTLGLINALILVMIDSIRLKRNQNVMLKNFPSTWKLSFNIFIIGLTYGLVDGVIFRYFGNSTVGMMAGVALGITYGITVELRSYRRALTEEIQAVEILHWSWPHALKGAVVGAIAGVGVGFIIGWIVAQHPPLPQRWASGPLMQWAGEDWFIGMGGLGGACVLSLIGAVFAGMRGQGRETRLAPDQGLRLSFRHALFSWLGFGLIIGVGGGLIFGLFSGLEPSIYVGLALFICFGSLAALWYGGLDLIQHYTLRLLLWGAGNSPLHLVSFLDYATQRIFLRKVGGGYVFIHRLFLEYFASLEKEDETR